MPEDGARSRSRSPAADFRGEKICEFVKTANIKSEPTEAWDATKVICFFSRSADGPPGKRPPETWPNDCAVPPELTGDFRKKFSDMHVASFRFRGDVFNSIEHVHHATKFVHKPKFYREFTIHGKYGADPYLAKQAGGKLGKVKGNPALNRPAGIIKDAAWESRKAGYLEEAQKAKYNAHPDLKQLLLSTGDALLLHHVMRRKGKVICRPLMKARTLLAKG